MEGGQRSHPHHHYVCIWRVYKKKCFQIYQQKEKINRTKTVAQTCVHRVRADIVRVSSKTIVFPNIKVIQSVCMYVHICIHITLKFFPLHFHDKQEFVIICMSVPFIQPCNDVRFVYFYINECMPVLFCP